jgi:hypothetical protein
METIRVWIWQFLIEAMAVTSIAAFIVLIISVALVRLVGWPRRQ